MTLCAAALVVGVLPTACSAAYADSEGKESAFSRAADESSTEADGQDGAESEAGGAEDGQDAAPGEDAAPDENAGPEEDPAGPEENPAGPGENAAPDENPAGPDENAGPEENAAGPEEKAKNDGNNGNANGIGNGGPGKDDGGNNGNANGIGNGRGGGNGEGNNGNGNGNGGPGKDDGGNNGNDGLDVLGIDCSNSNLEPHDGFEEGPRCVDTSFGEVSEADRNPSLLISESPDTVQAGQDFTLTVSTRNLVRDRFLGAAAGGYYKESSFLDGDGIQRGHFHTACRMLENADTAPEPGPEPEFFLATQDNGGGAAPDTVEVPVSGISEPGTLQCAVWAGDGSHRIPMMQRANQVPAFDIVRINVQ